MVYWKRQLHQILTGETVGWVGKRWRNGQNLGCLATTRLVEKENELCRLNVTEYRLSRCVVVGRATPCIIGTPEVNLKPIFG